MEARGCLLERLIAVFETQRPFFIFQIESQVSNVYRDHRKCNHRSSKRRRIEDIQIARDTILETEAKGSRSPVHLIDYAQQRAINTETSRDEA